MDDEKQKQVILEFLENSYIGARIMDNVELMTRLSRAIIAFSYNDMEHTPTLEEMQEAYINE